ncbi:hypothetical protein [Corynebacterium flavescens]|uniref:hypothetical protein n=1 Tax=Corynebacterium flavescens TaxID=28028 RepID=UPI000EC86C42|nr:hypothetical protein [Corynebacterium flavescens]
MTSRLADVHNRRRSRLVSALIALVLVVPLIVGAAVASFAGWGPAQAWSSAGDEASGAPTDGTVDSSQLVEPLRALSEAQAQAGFLESGAKQLADGSGQLDSGAQELGGGIDKLSGGSQQLVDGLTELQAGTARLGGGATELANGVGGAVDQIVGLGVAQGQIITAIDGTMHDLEGNNSPEARNIKSQLGDLRNQVNNFKLDQSVTDQLNRLKDGSRELSNQLSVSGYAYHDGVYSAVEGAKQLNSGIGELNGKADEAIAGVGKLDEGAGKVNSMAEHNKTKVSDAARAMPRVQATGQNEPSRLLSPVVALLIAALMMLGGVFLGFAWHPGSRPWLLLLGGPLALTAAGEILLWILSSGLTPLAAVWAGVAMYATTIATAALTTVVLRFAGFGIGGGLITVVGLAQLAAVGWVWKTAGAAAIAPAWQVVANLLPLNWATSAITAAGNGGQDSLLWTALAVLGVTAFLGVGAIIFGRRAGEATA